MFTKDQLYGELNYVNHSREKRNYYANLVIENPQLVTPLLDILFTVDDKISCRAAWVFEFMCSKNINAIIPFLDTFTQHIHRVHLDSAVRPIAKVCELVITAYYKLEKPKIKQHLKQNHKEQITEACFDWLIENHKVAPKAYGMNALYLLGTEFRWIHPELIQILERDFTSQSAAFKARARHIIKRVKR